jgi:hypothetical protein
MEPEEVASIYLKQAHALETFMISLKKEKYNKAELLLILTSICEMYRELLLSLAAHAPQLAKQNVKFYHLNELSNKMNLNEPPFEKDFFTRDINN